MTPPFEHVVVHFGTYNQDLIEAVVAYIPFSVNGYLYKGHPYYFDVADDGEFVGYVPNGDASSEIKIKSLIARRLNDVIKSMGEDDSFNCDRDGIFCKIDGKRNYLRHPSRYSEVYEWTAHKNMVADLAPGVRFNLNYDVKPFNVSKELVECFVVSLQKGTTIRDLENDFGKEMTAEMIGVPRNPVQQMQWKEFTMEFTKILEEMNERIKDQNSALVKLNQKYNWVGNLTKEEEHFKHSCILSFNKECCKIKEFFLEKIAGLREKFGV